MGEMSVTKVLDNLYHVGFLTMAAYIGTQVTSKLEDLSKTTQELNRNVAVLIERVANESHRIDLVEKEVTTLKYKNIAK
jgi:hypothetical protein